MSLPASSQRGALQQPNQGWRTAPAPAQVPPPNTTSSTAAPARHLHVAAAFTASATPVQQQPYPQQPGAAAGGFVPQQASPYATRSRSAGRPSALPDFVGTTVTLEGVIKRVVFRGDKGMAILSVQVDPPTWQHIGPLMTHKGLPQVKPSGGGSSGSGGGSGAAQGGGGGGASRGFSGSDYIQHKQRQLRLKNRLVTVRGFGMAAVAEGSNVRMAGHWRFNEKHGLEVECSSCVELPANDPAGTRRGWWCVGACAAVWMMWAMQVGGGAGRCWDCHGTSTALRALRGVAVLSSSSLHGVTVLHPAKKGSPFRSGQANVWPCEPRRRQAKAKPARALAAGCLGAPAKRI